MATILFVIAVFFGIWFTAVNTILAVKGDSIPLWNFVIMSASITAIITHLIGMRIFG